jgi:hypothetical protein
MNRRHRLELLFRVVLAALIVSVAATLPISAQARGGGATRIRACSLLTKDLVLKVSPPQNVRGLDLIPPEEEDIGARGSYCEYGDISLQVDPFANAQQMRTTMAKEWTAVAGVGDTAFFRDNKGMWGELIVWTGSHHFTIQMGIPKGSTAAAIRPNTVALANAIIPKLR